MANKSKVGCCAVAYARRQVAVFCVGKSGETREGNRRKGGLVIVMGRRPMNSARGLVVALQVNGAVIAAAIVVETRMFGMRFGLSRAMWDIRRPGHLPPPPET